MRRFAVVLFAGAAAVATAFAGFSLAGVSAPASVRATTVTVHLSEYKFVLDLSTVPAGAVTFNLINDGRVVHNFSIAGSTSDSVISGGTGTLTVNLTAGSYPYLCTIPGHAEAGMQGNLTVTGGTTTTVAKPTATVKVSEKEFKITLTVGGKALKSVGHGLIRFKVTNVGKIPHNFVIAKHQTPVLNRGKSATINVVLKKGRYKYVCSITGHAALGMKGTLVVT